MVIVRAGRDLQEQQILHLRRRQQLEQISVAEAAARMFKVPSSSHSQPIPTFAQQQQQQQSEMKRKWQEAFIQRGESRDTMLGLATPERPPQRQKTPPLTIFYAGSVNVYDNVPEDMVRALMTLAASKSSRPAAAAAMLNQLGRINNSNAGNSLNTYGFPVLSHAPQHHAASHPGQACSAHVAGFPVVSQLNHTTVNTNSNGNSNSSKNGFSNFLSIGTNNNVGANSTGFSTFHNTSLSLNSFRMEEKQSSAAPPVVQSMVGAGPTTTTTAATTTQSSITTTAAAATATAAGTSPTTSAGPNPAADLRRMSQLSPTTRMQLLPAGLPQARRASIQRFLEKRKQKQVNNNNNNQDEEAVAAAGAGAAGSGGASVSASSASPDKSSGHEEAAGTQVPHFLRRSS